MSSCEKEQIAAVARTSLDQGSRIVTVAVTIVLLLSVAINVLLARRVRTLSHDKSTKIAEYQLQIGATAMPFQAKRLGGQQEVVSYPDANQPTVMYVFTPPCSWCARNLENFKALVEKESNGYRFIAVSLADQGLSEYVAKNELMLPVYSGLSPETLRDYKLGSTPQTIVISPKGKVLQDWTGAYVGEQKSQVEAFFHIKLPGLRDLSKAEAPTQ